MDGTALNNHMQAVRNRISTEPYEMRMLLLSGGFMAWTLIASILGASLPPVPSGPPAVAYGDANLTLGNFSQTVEKKGTHCIF